MRHQLHRQGEAQSSLTTRFANGCLLQLHLITLRNLLRLRYCRMAFSRRRRLGRARATSRTEPC